MIFAAADIAQAAVGSQFAVAVVADVAVVVGLGKRPDADDGCAGSDSSPNRCQSRISRVSVVRASVERTAAATVSAVFPAASSCESRSRTCRGTPCSSVRSPSSRCSCRRSR